MFFRFSEEEEFKLASTAKQNEFRKVHQVPPMTLDRQMCDQAKAYAEKLKRVGEIQHSSVKNQGNNLAMDYATDRAPPRLQAMETPVINWYGGLTGKKIVSLDRSKV